MSSSIVAAGRDGVHSLYFLAQISFLSLAFRFLPAAKPRGSIDVEYEEFNVISGLSLDICFDYLFCLRSVDASPLFLYLRIIYLVSHIFRAHVSERDCSANCGLTSLASFFSTLPSQRISSEWFASVAQWSFTCFRPFCMTEPVTRPISESVSVHYSLKLTTNLQIRLQRPLVTLEFAAWLFYHRSHAIAPRSPRERK